MAIIKTTNTSGKFQDQHSIPDTIRYILSPYKTPHGLIGFVQVNPDQPAQSMMDVSASFQKSNGVQLNHYILAFEPMETSDTNVVYRIGQEVALYIGQKYQAVFAVHENKPYLHIHFVFNRVAYLDGQRWKGSRQEFRSLFQGIQAILRRYGIYTLIYSSNVKHTQSNPEF